VSDGYPASDGYPDPVLAASDTESCLVLVTSHLGAAPLVEAVTTEARRRIMALPMLGAFIDLRFMHLGPQPGGGAERSQAPDRITSQLLQPRIGVGRCFFAVVVLDRSATEAETVLADCARSPFLSELPLRLLGIASQEDRRKARVAQGAELLVSPHGAWRREELVGEIRRYADRLLSEFVGQPGISPAELAAQRDRYEAHAGQERAIIPRAGVPTTGGFPAVSGTGGFPAVPAAAPPTRDALDPGPAGGLDQRARPLPAGAAQDQQPLAPAPRAVPSVPDTAWAATPGEAREPARRWPSGLPRRLLPRVGWRRKAAAGDGGPPLSPPAAAGLAYLIPTGDERSSALAAWSSGRAMILEVDKRLATLPGIACRVRVLQGDENGLRGELREAGQLGKRDVKGAVADLYFAEVLDEIRKILGRDLARSSAALPPRRPLVVFFAAEPPLADFAAVRSFRALAQEASIGWVVPKSEADMMAGDFTNDGRLFTDFESVADDLAALLTQDHLDGTGQGLEGAFRA
jgi:hypothetical protein